MDPKKIQAGMPLQFSASFYNRLVDMLKDWERSKTLGGSGQTGMRSGATTVLIKNQSGSTVPQFGCLEISGTVGTGVDFENLKALRGSLPSTAKRPVVIVQGPAKNNELVEAVVVGATMAKVNVGSTAHTHAEPQSSSSTMVSGDTGRFRILHQPASTGVQNVLVRYEPAASKTTILIQAPAGGIPGRYQMKLGKATCVVVQQNEDPDISSDDEYLYINENPPTAVVYNWTTQPVCTAGDRFGVAAWCNDNWYIVSEDCADEGAEIGPMSVGSKFGDVVSPLDFTSGSISTTSGAAYIQTTTGTGIA